MTGGNELASHLPDWREPSHKELSAIRGLLGNGTGQNGALSNSGCTSLSSGVCCVSHLSSGLMDEMFPDALLMDVAFLWQQFFPLEKQGLDLSACFLQCCFFLADIQSSISNKNRLTAMSWMHLWYCTVETQRRRKAKLFSLSLSHVKDVMLLKMSNGNLQMKAPRAYILSAPCTMAVS